MTACLEASMTEWHSDSVSTQQHTPRQHTCKTAAKQGRELRDLPQNMPSVRNLLQSLLRNLRPNLLQNPLRNLLRNQSPFGTCIGTGSGSVREMCLNLIVRVYGRTRAYAGLWVYTCLRPFAGLPVLMWVYGLARACVLSSKIIAFRARPIKMSIFALCELAE